MKFVNTFKILLAPVLLPLSILYGLTAFVVNKFKKIKSKKIDSPVISVGNIYTGGTGKTPVVMAIADYLLKKNYQVVVISKNYKSNSKSTQEVFIDSDIKEVGDEAFLLKKNNDKLHVFSGPNKTQTIFYAIENLKNNNMVFIIDDGAQHFGVKKDLRFMVWDLNRSFLDLFPFPLGYSREFFFLADKADHHIFNRLRDSKKPHRLKNILGIESFIQADFEIEKIYNPTNSQQIEENFNLISGVGNFNQLKESVSSFCSKKGILIKSTIKGKDHDDFSWFKPMANNEKYVCTEKDYGKLVAKINPDRLYVAKGKFSLDFIKELESILDVYFNKLKA